MTQTAQVGTILIKQQPPLAGVLAIESDTYSGNWGVVRHFNGFTLDHHIHAAGWNFFFMAAQVKATFFGSPRGEKIQGALKKLLAKVRHQNFNSLEVTGIVSKSFLGISYGSVSAHPRHIQQSSLLEGIRERARV
jgi:hypothetical protein